MATHPFKLIIEGVNGTANILEDYSTASPETPWVDPSSIQLNADANGQGGSMSFEIVQVKTPAAGPWWRSGGVQDCARVRFQVASTMVPPFTTYTTEFLGFIESIDATLEGSGVGTRASITATAASNLTDRMLVYKGIKGTGRQATGSYVYQPSSGKTDQGALTALLSLVDARSDATTRGIFNTAAAGVYTGTAKAIPSQEFKPSTLRSALDQVVEAAQAEDGFARRWWISNQGVLNYGEVSTTTPTYGTAPFVITLDGNADRAGNPSKIVARNFSVQMDHSSIAKRIRFVGKDSDSALDGNTFASPTSPQTKPYIRQYNSSAPFGPGLTTRTGPMVEKIIQTATYIRTNASRATKINALANYYFGTNTYPNLSAPVRSVSFEIAGAGTGNNAYGWVYGNRQLTASTYTPQNGWAAGQWVKIEADAMGINGLFRIESISMSIEPGSHIRRFSITAERKRKGGLSKILAGELS